MCGVVGLATQATSAPSLTLALLAMQHRGQDGAGIVTSERGCLRLLKGLGPVEQALPASKLADWPGRCGIGHVRYPTHGGTGIHETQPYMTQLTGLALAHNGNLTNAEALEAHLIARGLRPLSRNDGELLMLVLADELRERGGPDSDAIVIEAVRAVMARVRGAYAVVVLLRIGGEDTVLCFRDPHGIRPAVYGSRGEDWAVVSESVALDALGFVSAGEVPPGHLLLLRPGRAARCVPIAPKERRRCAFEHVYFARPDSVLQGQRVHTSRWRMGEELARRWSERGLQADVVIAIPDTSRPAAQAMAEHLGLPHREGFIKNQYSGRTFIMPDAASREIALRLKLNPIREVFEGKRVLLVDDSVVRGATMRRIGSLVRSLGPKEVHLAVFSPPVRYPCFYGIDIPTKEELIANLAEEPELESVLCAHFGVDSVTYLEPEQLSRAIGSDLCSACFDGNYPVNVNNHERAFMQHQRRPGRGVDKVG